MPLINSSNLNFFAIFVGALVDALWCHVTLALNSPWQRPDENCVMLWHARIMLGQFWQGYKVDYVTVNRSNGLLFCVCLLQALGLPLYWKCPVFNLAGGDKAGHVTLQGVLAAWKKWVLNVFIRCMCDVSHCDLLYITISVLPVWVCHCDVGYPLPPGSTCLRGSHTLYGN